MTAQVYSYWTGPQPDWIGLCLDTLRRNSSGAQVLTADVWHDRYHGDIPIDAILAQRPNVQSDILRAWLLLTAGGVWVDADCIVWRDLSAVANWLGQYDFVAYRAAGNGGICSALIAARPTSQIAARYWQLIGEKMADGKRLPTLAIGPKLLRRAMLDVGLAKVHFLRPQWVHPLHWRKADKLRSRGAPRVHPRAWCWMLTHQSLGPMGGWSRKQILASDTWAGALYRRALGMRQTHGRRCCG